MDYMMISVIFLKSCCLLLLILHFVWNLYWHCCFGFLVFVLFTFACWTHCVYMCLSKVISLKRRMSYSKSLSFNQGFVMDNLVTLLLSCLWRWDRTVTESRSVGQISQGLDLESATYICMTSEKWFILCGFLLIHL